MKESIFTKEGVCESCFYFDCDYGVCRCASSENYLFVMKNEKETSCKNYLYTVDAYSNKENSVESNEVGHFERLVFLNTSILTSYGTFSYHPLELKNVKKFIDAAKKRDKEILSAVGHESTAKILTDLTEHEIPMNRIQYEQKFHDICIVFKLKGRPEEGKVLTIDEIEEIGYEFGILCLEY